MIASKAAITPKDPFKQEINNPNEHPIDKMTDDEYIEFQINQFPRRAIMGEGVEWDLVKVDQLGLPTEEWAYHVNDNDLKLSKRFNVR